MAQNPKLRIRFFFSFCLLILLGGIPQSCTPSAKDINGQTKKDQGIPVIDSTTVTRWDVSPKGDANLAYTVYKDSGLYWTVTLADKNKADADLKVINRSLRHFSDFKNMQPASLDQAKWKAEQIDDKGTHLTVYVNNQKADSFIIGKLEFSPQNKSSYYIRKAGTDKVYTLTPDYLEGSIIAPAESFRKKDMVPVSYTYFKTLKIVTPGSNQYYLIENLHGKWSINGQDADQQKVNGFIRILNRIQIPSFAKPPSGVHPDASITIETRYGPIKLSATREDASDKWIIASSVNIGNYLLLNTGQVNALFLPVTFFMPAEK
jgi:hypothetical protein